MESQSTSNKIDYNEVLNQISANLTNALDTYGPSSSQYQIVLEMLKDCLRDIDNIQNKTAPDLDPDTLSLAMGFLKIGK
ncbi:hypothetical protein BJX99DRAFT_255576 [Aspergillus californicus]